MSGETKISADIAKMIDKEFADYVFIDRHQCGVIRVQKRFIHCGKKGVSDRLGFIRKGQYAGKFIGIEVKGKDGKQSSEQIEFQQKVEAANCFYLLVDSVDDCREQLKKILGELP
jgi:hypothetical protein